MWPWVHSPFDTSSLPFPLLLNPPYSDVSAFSCLLPLTLRPYPLAYAHTHRLAIRDPFLSWTAAILTTLLGVIRLRMVLSQAKCGSANVGYIADYNHRASGYQDKHRGCFFTASLSFSPVFLNVAFVNIPRANDLPTAKSIPFITPRPFV